MQSPNVKALLRIQDSDRRLFHKCNVKGVEIGVALTSVAFVHQEMAENFALKSFQLLTLAPRLASRGSTKNCEVML
ncbi:hypothetical protein SLA2020_319420 [Shorea laevis]